MAAKQKMESDFMSAVYFISNGKRSYDSYPSSDMSWLLWFQSVLFSLLDQGQCIEDEAIGGEGSDSAGNGSVGFQAIFFRDES